jgi:hypothetical protein
VYAYQQVAAGFKVGRNVVIVQQANDGDGAAGHVRTIVFGQLGDRLHSRSKEFDRYGVVGDAFEESGHERTNSGPDDPEQIIRARGKSDDLGASADF